MSTLSDYRDRLAESGVPVLGRLVWYSVSETLVPHNDLVRILVRNNLSGYMPRVPTDLNVFRRVCTATQKNRVPAAAGTWSNYLVRDVGYDNDNFYKRIVRETVNASGQRLDYVEMCDVTFRRKTSEVEIVCHGASDHEADYIAGAIKDSYIRERNAVNGYGVREMIRRILLDAGATNVRGPAGGVYFVAEEHGATVDSLEEVGKALTAAIEGTVDVHSLPLIDDSKQREMVRKAFESDTVYQADELMGEIADLLRGVTEGKAITDDRKVMLLERYHTMGQKVKSYSDLLQFSLDTATARLDILRSQLVQLQAS